MAPTNAKCAVITVSNSTTVTRQFELTPQSSTVFALDGLPLGEDTFNAAVFTVPCKKLDGALPEWIADPVTATVVAGMTISVTLTMRQVQDAGKANVGLNFPPPSSAMIVEFPGLERPLNIAAGPDAEPSGYSPPADRRDDDSGKRHSRLRCWPRIRHHRGLGRQSLVHRSYRQRRQDHDVWHGDDVPRPHPHRPTVPHHGRSRWRPLVYRNQCRQNRSGDHRWSGYRVPHPTPDGGPSDSGPNGITSGKTAPSGLPRRMGSAG